MVNTNIVQITAVCKVLPVGEICEKLLIKFDQQVKAESVSKECFEVKERNILDVTVAENTVRLALNPLDEKAKTYIAGMPFRGIEAHMVENEAEVRIVKTFETENGTVIQQTDFLKNTNRVNEAVDRFVFCEFEDIKYALFVPEDYDSSIEYPIVQFIHDASACGDEPRLTLCQGVGALSFAEKGFQKKHPCFVFAPQFSGKPIVDDEWNVSEKLETAKRALDYVIDNYSIDRNRVYTTGQSMGCMASIVLNVRYPDYFAASFLVAGQWDDRNINGLEKQNLWMMCSQGDAKAFPIMNQMCVQMEKAGANVAHKVIEANLSEEAFAEATADIVNSGANVIHTVLKLETVANGWHSNGGEHHVNTWQSAYDISAVKEWMFSKIREEQ